MAAPVRRTPLPTEERRAARTTTSALPDGSAKTISASRPTADLAVATVAPAVATEGPEAVLTEVPAEARTVAPAADPTAAPEEAPMAEPAAVATEGPEAVLTEVPADAAAIATAPSTRSAKTGSASPNAVEEATRVTAVPATVAEAPASTPSWTASPARS